MAADRPAARSNTYALIYASALPKLQEIANSLGYAMCVHGSMQRDLDIVCVPWVENAEEPAVLIRALKRSFKGIRPTNHMIKNPEKKPHGRLAWSFYFTTAEASTLNGPYIDISVMPRSITT